MNQHHITVTISRSRFAENIRLLCKSIAPAKLCVVMKADAYGHGLDSVHTEINLMAGLMNEVTFVD